MLKLVVLAVIGVLAFGWLTSTFPGFAQDKEQHITRTFTLVNGEQITCSHPQGSRSELRCEWPES